MFECQLLDFNYFSQVIKHAMSFENWFRVVSNSCYTIFSTLDDMLIRWNHESWILNLQIFGTKFCFDSFSTAQIWEKKPYWSKFFSTKKFGAVLKKKIDIKFELSLFCVRSSGRVASQWVKIPFEGAFIFQCTKVVIR